MPATFSLQQLATGLTLTCVTLAVARYAPLAIVCFMPLIVCFYASLVARQEWKDVPYRSATSVSLLVYGASHYEVAVGFVAMFVQAVWILWYADGGTQSAAARGVTVPRGVTVVLAAFLGGAMMVLHFVASGGGG